MTTDQFRNILSSRLCEHRFSAVGERRHWQLPKLVLPHHGKVLPRLDAINMMVIVPQLEWPARVAVKVTKNNPIYIIDNSSLTNIFQFRFGLLSAFYFYMLYLALKSIVQFGLLSANPTVLFLAWSL